MIDRRLDRIAQRIDTAARMKPAVDRHIMQQLDECDTQATNETGISAKGTFNDPVMNAVMRRGHVINASNAIDAAVVALEHAEAQLSAALRAVKVPAVKADHEPRCWWAQCGELVEHYTRSDGSTGFRTSGLCARHRKQREREERDEREVA